MNEDDVKSTIKVYGGLLNSHGADSSMGLGWSSSATQKVRFKVLAEIAPLEGCSLLDLGCGVGDLYGYLVRQGLKIDYCGVDVCPKMIEAACGKYPGTEFLEGDLEQAVLGRRFDYVLISGTFNWTISDNRGLALRGLKKAWAVCNKGVASNFLSTRDPYKVDYLYYFSPQEMKEYAENVAPRVEMRHDYKLYDFTLYLYRDTRRGTRDTRLRQEYGGNAGQHKQGHFD